jgi:hypothetical protein
MHNGVCGGYARTKSGGFSPPAHCVQCQALLGVSGDTSRSQPEIKTFGGKLLAARERKNSRNSPLEAARTQKKHNEG